MNTDKVKIFSEFAFRRNLYYQISVIFHYNHVTFGHVGYRRHSLSPIFILMCETISEISKRY
jgi:hypothetical protein